MSTIINRETPSAPAGGRRILERLREAGTQTGVDASLAALARSCRTLMSERGEANSVKFAQAAVSHYRQLTKEGRAAFFDVLAEQFAPDPAGVLSAAQRYAETRSPDSLVDLMRAAEPPRQELLRRLNRAADGTATLLAIRRDLLQEMKAKPRLAAVEADLHHLLSSWFNPGFLRLERVDWRAPALLLEKIIRYEAVHEIGSWAALRRRLEPDRRCFAFFHPALPDDPLIFVEVALVHQMPAAIGPLLDDERIDSAASAATCAVFYSISNCQPGLRGVSLGNFLIKRVCEVLKDEFPRLRTFCTLSPIPGLAKWIQRGVQLPSERLAQGGAARVEQALTRVRPLIAEGSPDLGSALARATPVERGALLRLGAAYLHGTLEADAGSDPVAKFHLHNGAQLARLNFLANPSPRGLRESFGLMVNYLYDLRRIERNHERFVHGRIAAAREVTRLL
jgi:malonyl-CoA decarboxylase